MPARPLILLPPSAGKAPGGNGPSWTSAPHRFPELHPLRRAVRDAVHTYVAQGGDAGRLLGAGERALADVLRQWTALDEASTLPAAERYTGVVWQALGRASMCAGTRRRLAGRVLVISGLWGVVGAADPIPPYRLPMGVSLPGLGALAAFWRPHVTATIAAAAGGGWVFDLLPDEHAAAIDDAGLRRCRVEIVHGDRDGRRPVGHAGKALKGRLARAILDAAPGSPAALARLDVPGLRAIGCGPRLVTFATVST